MKFFSGMGEKYKAEIISIPEKEAISLYGQGDWIDLCRGPHVPSTGKLKTFKLMRVAGAYWRGDSRNEMLQRIYGTAWGRRRTRTPTSRCSRRPRSATTGASARSSIFSTCRRKRPAWCSGIRRLGALAAGRAVHAPRLHRENGYHEVRAPQILDHLWERTGHWENFRENMFTTSENRDYAVKPMNCPGHILIYNKGVRSYRDCRCATASSAPCHRNEPSARCTA